jgi:hypothetical protein
MLLACAVALAPCFAAGAEPRIAILPVLVHSGSPNSGYLSDGLSDMLAARLEQLGGMRVVREEGGAKATTRLQHAVERGKALGADFVVFGSFTQFGDGASLDLQCAPVGGADPEAARTLFIQSGAIGEIIPKLDDLADKIAYYVLGDAGGKSAVSARSGSATPIRDVMRRLEELERQVYGKSGAPAVTAPAPKPAAATPAEDVEAEADAGSGDGNGSQDVPTAPKGPAQGPSRN